jgi:hypothetical protein
VALLVTDLDNAMKTKYIKGLNKLAKKKLVLDKSLTAGATIPVGKTYRIAYETALSEGNGMFDYNGALADAGASQYGYMEGTVKHHNIRIQVYGADLDFTDTEEKAYVNGVENEIKNAGIADSYEQERMAYWDGSGKLGKFTASGASHSNGVVTVTLDTAFTGINACKYVRKGMKVDLYNNTTPITNGVGLTVLNRTSDTTFTVTGDAQLAADINTAGTGGSGYCYKKGSYGSKEYYGLVSKYGVNNNTLLGINRATAGNEFFIPRVYYQGSSGPVLGNKQTTNYDWLPKDLRKIIRDLISSQGAEKSDLRIFCTPDVEDYMIQQQIDAGEQMVRDQTVDNWPYKVVKFNDIPVLSSELCVPNCIFIVNIKNERKFNCRNLTWQYFGQSFWKPVSGYDSYEAYAVERKENGLVMPTQSGAFWNIKGIDD